MLLNVTEIRDGIGMALGAIKANKFRAFLTILGVMIGVGSVICLAAIIDGLNGAMEAEIDQLGSNIIMISKFAPEQDHEQLTDEDRNRPPITINEARIIQQQANYVDGVAPRNFVFQSGGNEARYKGNKFNRPMFCGTWPDFTKVSDLDVVQGRFLSPTDDQYRLMVCVIGSDVKNTLFGDENPIGAEIKVNSNKFEVIGVLESVKSSFGNDNENRMVFIPLSTFEKLHPWEEELGLMVRANSYENVDKAIDEITGLLRAYRKVPFNKADNFALTTQDQFKETVGNITKYIYIAMIVITSVGLLVGGIGVMNIMLVSVTERTREIGVRKAIGAKRINIILQFLTEAMTLSGAGGIIGVIFGVLIGLVLNAAFGFPLSIPVLWIVIGFSVSVSVGLISGVYPAIKAAYLDPIEALRYE
jgi:putative ABC transport system permease protein